MFIISDANDGLIRSTYLTSRGSLFCLYLSLLRLEMAMMCTISNRHFFEGELFDVHLLLVSRLCLVLPSTPSLLNKRTLYWLTEYG